MAYFQLFIYLYFPVILLLLLTLFKDRFEPESESLKRQNWSLIPVIIILIFYLSLALIQWFWSAIPFVQYFEYNSFNFEVYAFVDYAFIFILALVYFYRHRVSVITAFNLKLNQFPFIVKLCAVLLLFNALSIYFLNFNLIINPLDSQLNEIKSLNWKVFIFYFFNTVILAPVVEETVFRGLLYSPLYRKLGGFAAAILSSLLWTHSHFYPLLPSIGVFITGLFFVWLYKRRGSLIHPIVFHMFKNSWMFYYYLKGS